MIELLKVYIHFKTFQMKLWIIKTNMSHKQFKRKNWFLMEFWKFSDWLHIPPIFYFFYLRTKNFKLKCKSNKINFLFFIYKINYFFGFWKCDKIKWLFLFQLFWFNKFNALRLNFVNFIFDVVVFDIIMVSTSL